MNRIQVVLLLAACVGSSAFASHLPRACTSALKPLRSGSAKPKKPVVMVAGAGVFANAEVGQKLLSAKGVALKLALGLRGGQLDFATTVAPAMGAAIANAMFLSGLPAVNAARKNAALGDLNPLPFPIAFGNCLGWMVYGLLLKNPFVVAANAPGLLLASYYVMTGMKLASAEQKAGIEKTFMAIMVIHTSAALVGGFGCADLASTAALYGLVNNAILLAYYGAPLSSMATVLKTKSSASIYAPTVMINFLNGAFWSLYALAIKDTYLFVPNAIGAALATSQLALWAIFRGGGK